MRKWQSVHQQQGGASGSVREWEMHGSMHTVRYVPQSRRSHTAQPHDATGLTHVSSLGLASHDTPLTTHQRAEVHHGVERDG